MRSGGIPIRSHRSIATWSGPSSSSGSPAWTLTQIRSQSSCIRSRMNSVAYSIAPSLKYWPNEKLPEHLEERQVVRVEADILDVGRAEDLLDGRRERRGRRLEAEEVAASAAACPRS